MNETPVTSIRIPAEVKAALEKIAAREGRPFSNLVIKVLRDFARKTGDLKPEKRK